jgi:hypothetical protein
VWDGIAKLIEEIDLKLLKARNGDMSKKRFQVSTGTFKPKPAKVGKGDLTR